MPWYVWAIIALVVLIISANYSNKKKRERLMLKYNDPNLVDMIMRRQIWQGQNLDQLIDSLGIPADKSQQVLKTKVKETWKYRKTGNNRYALKIFVEDGFVVGWDKK